MSIVRLLIALCVLGVSGCVLNGSGRFEKSPKAVAVEHGLWITRWDYQSPDDVRRAIADAASIGITDIYWQVRGQADAYYPSANEPWGIEILKYNANPPGFDPLQIAITESKVHQVRIHAWVNVMPMWRGKIPPRDRSHIFHTHPEWRLRDDAGNMQALHEGYVVVNPVLDDVHDHIVGVIRDIVNRYDIDGIHLDYIRYLADEIKPGQLMPGDPISRALYAKDTQSSSEPSKIDRKDYQRWISSRISTLVERIDKESIRNHRGVRLSAAVWRRPEIANDRYLQDAVGWVNGGFMDAVMPMIYTDDNEQYASDLASWHAQIQQTRIIPGIGAYKHAMSSQTSYQIAIGHPKRFAIFAYSTIFESPNPDQKKDQDSKRLRSQKRDALADLMARVGSHP
ncbi:MAG: family 10 glycosylhydrolase [Phycisphaerales bacterium]|nr:family 10 glycosylhydrolase [Phycisphaerales bacterium]